MTTRRIAALAGAAAMAATSLIFVAPSATAATTSTTVEVPATANPWLATRTGPWSSYQGTDPVYVPVTPGSTVTVNATGQITCDMINYGGPDGTGACGISNMSVDASNGFSGVSNSVSAIALTGVFTANSVADDATPPPTLRFGQDATTDTLSTNYQTLAPLVNQTFFVGDGKFSFDGVSAAQTLTVPANATRLYLGMMDAPNGTGTAGAYDNNGGTVNATVSVTEPTSPPPAPTPTSPIVSDVATNPRFKVQVDPLSGRTDTIYTATVVGLCEDGRRPTLRVGNSAQNYLLPQSSLGSTYSGGTTPVVLIRQTPLSRNKSAFTFRSAVTGPSKVYPFCGQTQGGVGSFAVRGAAFVSLGDSYSSGEGADPKLFYGGTNSSAVGCHRSSNAWPVQLAKRNSYGNNIAIAACSGATLSDLYTVNTQWVESMKAYASVLGPEVPQLDQVNENTKRVSMSMGGNDVGFEKVLTGCIQGPKTFEGQIGCSTKNTDLINYVNSQINALANGLPITQNGRTIKKSLADAYVDIAMRAAPDAKIVIAGYPRLFGTDRKNYKLVNPGTGDDRYRCILNGTYRIGYEDAQWINSVDQLGNQTIAAQVQIARSRLATLRPGVKIEFADVWAEFGNHSLCDSQTSWINSLILSGTPTPPNRRSFHPTPSGQDAYAAAASKALRRMS